MWTPFLRMLLALSLRGEKGPEAESSRVWTAVEYGQNCLQSLLLGRLRQEDCLRPGVLGYSTLYSSDVQLSLDVHTKFGIIRVT